MIHVQIASQVTADGVDGIRWVLVDGGSAPAVAAPPPAALLAAAAEAPTREASARSQVSLALLKAAVLGLGLGTALWACQVWLGPTTVPWLAPSNAAGPAQRPVPTDSPADRPTGVRPMPTPNAPAASAPLVTAELR